MRTTVASTRRPGARRIEREARLVLSRLAARGDVSGHADAALIEACVAYAAMRDRTAPRSAGSEGQTEAAEPIPRRKGRARADARLLRTVAAKSATTPEGHRARAAAFVIWDEGDLLGRARADGILQEMLLAAILADLVTR